MAAPIDPDYAYKTGDVEPWQGFEGWEEEFFLTPNQLDEEDFGNYAEDVYDPD